MTNSAGTPSDESARAVPGDVADAAASTVSDEVDTGAVTLTDETADVTISDEAATADVTFSDELLTMDATFSDELRSPDGMQHGTADVTFSDEAVDLTVSEELRPVVLVLDNPSVDFTLSGEESNSVPAAGDEPVAAAEDDAADRAETEELEKSASSRPAMEMPGQLSGQMSGQMSGELSGQIHIEMPGERHAEMPGEKHAEMHAHGTTDVGLIREQNEDYFLIGDVATEACRQPGDEEGLRCQVQSKGPLLMVCDGLGGAAAGEVASQMAAETIWSEMRAAQEATERVVYARLLRRAVRVANRRVWEGGRRNSKLRGMGSTATVAGVVGDSLLLAQVGDSRAYLLRSGDLMQLTRDQNLVSALVRSGRVPQSEAYLLPGSNMVLQALGVRKDVEVALSFVELRRGDRVLLCSDGLHGPVPDIAIADMLGRDSPLATIADSLIDLAIQVGAPDNVTAVVASFDGDGLRPVALDEPLPEYSELDPAEEGPRGIFRTSMIARRLAARIGIGEDPNPPAVPATGNFTAINREALGLDESGPAHREYDRRARLDRWVRATAVATAILALIVLYWLLF